MPTLSRFRVEGFKGKSRFAEVNFSNSEVSVMYGPNGAGKTTYLRMLHAFLAQNTSALLAVGITRLECDYFDGDETKTVVVERNETDYNWESFLASSLVECKSMSLGVERGISNQAFRIEPVLLYEFFTRSPFSRSFSMEPRRVRDMVDELAMFIKRRQHSSRSRTSELDFSLAHINLQNIKLENISSLLVERYQFARVMATKKIQSALFDTLAIAISEDGPKESEQQTLNPDFLSTLKANSERIAEALNDSTENTFKTKLIEILESLDDEKTKNLLTNRLLVTLLKKMIKELEVEKLMLSSINLLTDTFNEYLIDSKKLVFKENRVVIEIEGDEHDLEDLSSGERHILTFLSLVLFGARERDFLIIDEPEISLNILWQRKLMALFTKLAPSTQIIVASHSPAIAKDNRKYLSELRVGKI